LIPHTPSIKLPLVVAVALALPSVATYAQNRPDPVLESTAIAASLDWHPIEVLPESAHNLRCRQCRGAFIDPLANAAPVDQATADIEVRADSSSSIEGRMTFEGDVTAQQGNRSLRADRANFDREQRLGSAEGNVVLREPGLVLLGDSATLDNSQQRATLTNARFALHASGLNGQAASLSRNQKGQLEIEDGAMSYCAPTDIQWQLQAEHLTLDPETGDGTARGAWLKLGGLPVFYMPWVRFPIDDRRKTGLLFPTIGSDTRGGLDITQPVYFNLAPNYDATYSPRYMADRGFMHQLNARYLGKNAGYWDIDGAYLSGDERYQDDYPGSDGDRWLLGIQQQGRIGSAWRTRINYGKVSDTDYLRDLNNSTLSTQRQTALMQLAQLDYLGKDIAVSIQAQQFQSLAEDIRADYKKLPQITAQWRGDVNWGGVEPIGLVQYSHFDSDDKRVTGERLYSEVGLTYPMSWSYAFLRPTVKMRSVSYELDDFAMLKNTQPSATSPQASLDAGLIFEREFNWGDANFTQTLEPRAYYLYSQYEDQSDLPDFDSAELTFSYEQLYRSTRFSGRDRLDDANQLSLGVTTRFFDNDDGRERFNASVGQVYFFRDRRVRLKGIDPDLTDRNSAIAAEANWLPDDQWRVRASMLYDTTENSWDAASVQVGYRPNDGSVFNVGYTLREPPASLVNRPVTEQFNISAYYPINDNWRVFGAFQYSLEASEPVEDMFGFEYDDCCWQVRLLYMRYLDTAGRYIPDLSDPRLERENALQFQFVLKGMGSFGTRVESLMRDMIQGFRSRDY